jgi:flagellar basal-body rod protein FlgB
MKDISALMQRAMDGAWSRHEVLSQNVANAETPGYKRQDVDFRSFLQRAGESKIDLVSSDKRHISGQNSLKLRVTENSSSVTPDENGVDMDIEMGEVSSNALYYAAVSRQMSAHLSMIRKAITEGRR